MNHWSLIWANLTRRRARFIFTLLSVIFAFALFGVLLALRQAFNAGPRFERVARLLTFNAVSLTVQLPLADARQIGALPGVRAVDAQAWFGGYFREPSNAIYALAVQARPYLQVYPLLQLPRAQRRAWLADRRGVLIGKDLARRYRWRIGAQIPLRSSIWRNRDGTNSWQVIVAGIVSSPGGRQNNLLLLHYRYLDDARTFANGTASFFVLRIAHPGEADRIGRSIDALFANSPEQTRTAPEAAFVRDFTSQFGDIAAIVSAVVSAVFFTMLLVTGNTMMQSVRERLREFALLRSLGFGTRRLCVLILLESLTVTALGGALGLAGAYALVASFSDFAAALLEFLPGLRVPSAALPLGGAFMLLLGALAAMLPIVTLLTAPAAAGLREG